MRGMGGAAAPEQVVQEGWLKKKKNRVHLWDRRYFVLALGPPRLIYYIKHPDTGAQPRGTFDLTDGCFVTDVEELHRGKGKKPLYVIWLVWPDLPKLAAEDSTDAGADAAAEAKHEMEGEGGDDGSESEGEEEDEQRKTLKKVVHDENNAFKTTQQRAEQQIEKHHNYDSYLKNGAKVAAVGAGAVVVGAFTAGIGLIPYMTVLGMAAIAAGGGGVAVAYGYRRPSNSRLVLATESLATVLQWKDALEQQLGTLEAKKSLPPEQVSFKFASAILEDKAPWRVVDIHEGMRVLECAAVTPGASPKEGTEVPRQMAPWNVGSWFQAYKVCRKAQLRIPAPTEYAFLSIMENRAPFLRDYLEDASVVQQLDNHSDVLHAKARQSSCYRRFGLVQNVDICVMRYWCMEEDGTYVISMNSVEHEECPKPPGVKRMQIQAVITIAPRANSDTRKDSLVTCACEISNVDAWTHYIGFDTWLVDGFLRQLVEVRAHVQDQRYVGRSGSVRKLARRPSRRSTQSRGAYDTQSSAGESDLSQAQDQPSAPLEQGRRRFLRRRSREDPQQAEVTYLRDTIGDREQQITRLEKRIKKEGKKQQNEARALDLQDLLLHMQELLDEVDALKAAYLKVAGTAYEPRKSFFSSRQRSDRSVEQTPPTPAANEQQRIEPNHAALSTIVLPGVTVEPITATDPSHVRRPSAWNFELDLEDDDVKQQVHVIQERGYKNAMLVALFVACLSLTMLLTAFLEK